MEIGNSKRESSAALTTLTLVVMLVGAAAVARAGTEQALTSKYGWIFMIAIALFAAPINTVKIPGVQADIVLGDVVTFSCAVLFGAGAAVIAAVADSAITSLRVTRSLRKIFYNVATCAVSMAIATRLTQLAFVDFAREGVRPSAPYMIGAVALLTLIYYVVQTVLIAAYIASSTTQRLWKLWREKFAWTIVSYIVGGVFAVTSFVLSDALGQFVFLLAAAVIVITAFLYKTVLKRLAQPALSLSNGINEM